MKQPTPLVRSIAETYNRLLHRPNWDVAVAYDALKSELWQQYQLLSAFVDVRFTPVDPYRESTDMFRDIEKVRLLAVYTFAELPADHPFAEVSPNGQTFNSIFRAVHDGLAHYPGRHSFAPTGEFRAFQAHCRLLSDDAKHAVATETLAQNCWLQVHGTFAPQKACLLPWSIVTEALQTFV